MELHGQVVRPSASGVVELSGETVRFWSDVELSGETVRPWSCRAKW